MFGFIRDVNSGLLGEGHVCFCSVSLGKKERKYVSPSIHDKSFKIRLEAKTLTNQDECTYLQVSPTVKSNQHTTFLMH